jgi:hypothetical protein
MRPVLTFEASEHDPPFPLASGWAFVVIQPSGRLLNLGLHLLLAMTTRERACSSFPLCSPATQVHGLRAWDLLTTYWRRDIVRSVPWGDHLQWSSRDGYLVISTDLVRFASQSVGGPDGEERDYYTLPLA